MTPSGDKIRAASLVFVFKLARLVLKHISTCIQKPKTNTIDKSSKLFFIFIFGRFRSFQVILDQFRSFLGHF